MIVSLLFSCCSHWSGHRKRAQAQESSYIRRKENFREDQEIDKLWGKEENTWRHEQIEKHAVDPRLQLSELKQWGDRVEKQSGRWLKQLNQNSWTDLAWSRGYAVWSYDSLKRLPWAHFASWARLLYLFATVFPVRFASMMMNLWKIVFFPKPNVDTGGARGTIKRNTIY